MVLRAGVDTGARIPVSSPMIPMLRVLVAAGPVVDEPEEDGAAVVAGATVVEEVLVDADFDDELQAATPATSTAAATPASVRLELNHPIIEPP
jgi:hypothetical protein